MNIFVVLMHVSPRVVVPERAGTNQSVLFNGLVRIPFATCQSDLDAPFLFAATCVYL